MIPISALKLLFINETKYIFQEEDKEEMKEILEMKRTHEKLYKKRQLKSAKEKTVTREDNIIL